MRSNAAAPGRAPEQRSTPSTLKSHIFQGLREAIVSGRYRPGDRLNESKIARELNTLSAKANDAEISQLVVRCKAELEKIREQIQNVE